MKFNESIKGKGTLALAFILYNEAESIEQAIKAFWYNGTPIYDLLVIGIDNKTTDNTLEIVKKYCPDDNIFFFDFNDDFGGSRNTIIDKINNENVDWVIMPDGHEILRPESLDVVKYYVDNGSDDIWLISPYIEIDVDENDIADLSFPRPIFFRNKKGIKFERKVHNYLNAPMDNKATSPEIRFIHNMPHDRKKMRGQQRKDMNIPELRKNAESGDIRDLFYLGNTLVEVQEIDEAIEVYEKCLERTTGDDIDLAAQICVALAPMYIKKKQWQDVKRTCHEGLFNRWDRAELVFFLGYQAAARSKEMDFGSFAKKKLIEQAIHWFELTTTMELPVTVYFIQMKHYTWLPHDALSDIYNDYGDLEKALYHCEKVLSYKKNDATALSNKEKLKEALFKTNNQELVTISQDVDPFN